MQYIYLSSSFPPPPSSLPWRPSQVLGNLSCTLHSFLFLFYIFFVLSLNHLLFIYSTKHKDKLLLDYFLGNKGEKAVHVLYRHNFSPDIFSLLNESGNAQPVRIEGQLSAVRRNHATSSAFCLEISLAQYPIS